MRKFTLLLALGLSFLWNSGALAIDQATYGGDLWWLRIENDGAAAWQDVDHNTVFYNKSRGFVRMGSAHFYFQADYHHVYINELVVTTNIKNVTIGGTYYAYKSNGTFEYCACEHSWANKQNHVNAGHEIKTLTDGQTLRFKDVKEYIHVWSTYNHSNGSIFTARANINISNWTNITHSTSEGGYKNYLTNEYLPKDRVPNYFEVDEHGDGTYLLHPGWLCNIHTDYDNYYDNHNYVTDTNWTGESGTVIDMHDHYGDKYGGWQEVTLDHAGVYTVQAIVRGPAGGKVKLRLSSNGNSSESEQDVYGEDDNSPSTVNPFGRVDYWDMGTNAGWTKVETKVAVAADGKLKIELLSDAAFEVSDVTLLKDANQDDVSFWTTAGLDENSTSRQLLTTKTFYFDQELYGTTILIHYPYYNKFSFFDRGTNRNGVVYAHPKTVIGMPAGMADHQDHAHECNVAVPYYDLNTVYSYGVENNVEEETTITCKKLKLSDTDGSQWGNVHAFGLPEGKNFTANEVTFDRQYKNGQKSTCVFPFAMTGSELTSFFGSNEIYEFASIDGTTANFNKVTSGSTANKPFLVYPTKDGEISLGSKTIVANNNLTTENGGNKFVGIYRYTAFPAGYSQDTSEPHIYMFNAAHPTGYYGGIHKNGADIKPFRAYIEVPRSASAAPAGFFVNFLFNEQTAISDIFNENQTNSTIYRLDGTRVTNTNSLQKGIYIVNGKKVILK